MRTNYGKEVRNKKLVSLLEKEGVKSVFIHFLDGFASVRSDDDQTDLMLHRVDNSIEVKQFNWMSIQEWFDAIMKMYTKAQEAYRDSIASKKTIVIG